MKTIFDEKSSGKVVKSKVKRVLIFSGILILLLVIFAMLLAPGMAKNYINKHGKELAGRTVYIDNLKYNYFTSTLEVDGFRYFEINDKDIFASCDTFLLDIKPLKMLHDEVFVQQLKVINPFCNVIQNDSVFNFDDLITFFNQTDTAKHNEKSTTDYKLNLNNLEMKNGSVFYTDQKIDHTFKTSDVSFYIKQIIWSHLDSSKADIAFNLADGGSFEGSLDYNLETSDYSGFIHIDKMAIKNVYPYLKESINISKLEGTASGTVNFSGVINDPYKILVSGNFAIDSLGIYDLKNRKVLGLASSEVVFNPSLVMKSQYLFDSVILYNPYIYLALEDSLFNFEKMMIDTGNTNESDSMENKMDVVLNSFIIENGLIDFSDQRFIEVFDYELSQVAVNMDTISLNDEWVNINAAMKLNKRGTLKAKLGVNPADPMKRIELDYVLTDFQLPDINIYSKHYAGVPILFGDMYYINKTKIVNHQLESNNQLIIRNVEMGRKTGGLYDVPIKLALFILKDIHGDIHLDIPVRGDLSDPKVRIGAIVWDTFKSFMFKIVVSPFKALGNLLGADPKELEEITFDYGDTTLVVKQTRSFDLLLDLEKKKPELLVELHYFNDKKLEKTDAASELVTQMFFSKYGKKAKSNNKEYLQFLKEETGKDSLVMQDYERLIAPLTRVDSVLRQREKIRLDLVKNYISAKNDSTTIRIFEYNPDEVLNIGSRPRFEVRYILKEDAEE